MGWVFDHTDTYTVNLTDCDSQQAPSVPDVSRWIVTSDEIRNPSWSSLNRYTYERQIQYGDKTSGTGPSWTIKSSSGFIQTGD